MLMPKCSRLIERRARAAASSITMRPAAASSGVHSEGSHPSDKRPQRSRAAGAVPPSHTSRGCCTGSGASLTSRKLPPAPLGGRDGRSEEHTSELQSRLHLVCRLLLRKKKHSQN